MFIINRNVALKYRAYLLQYLFNNVDDIIDKRPMTLEEFEIILSKERDNKDGHFQNQSHRN